VKQNKRSERIDLIQEEIANRGTTSVTSTTALVASTEAITDFEKEFRQAIEESRLNWNDNSKAQLPPSVEIQAQKERSQMARIRTLMRAEQIRARRLKKIKSKTYRKLIRKKEMKGMEDLIAKLDREDPEAAEQIRSELEKRLSSLRLNRQRQARIKWSQAAQRFGGREMRSEISRQAQAEQDQKRELVRAIKGGKEGADSDDDSSMDSENDEEDDIVAQVKKAVNEKLKNPSQSTEPQTGLMGMKFMKEAEVRKRNQTLKEADDFVSALEREDSERSGDDAEEENGDTEDVNETCGNFSQTDLVASLFAAPVEPVSEPSEKKNKPTVRIETPKEGDSLPGWGAWVGEGVRQRKRKQPVYIAENKNATKSALVHVLDEATIKAPLMKYQVKEIPYPYQSRAEYEAATSMPLGPEWQSLTAHTETIQPKICARLGAVVPPIKLAKHLDADKRAKIIDAWDNRKKTKHTKARFL
jgi:U3 small nucleolar RNA-associated protein 14